MVTYRLANSEDYENINSFYNRIYKTNRSLEQFYWEFHNGPFGASIYVIAEDNGQVVGTNCVIPIDFITSDNRTIRTGKSEDTLVDPSYRGQKIFYKIYEFLFKKCEEQGIKIIWGFTSAKKPFKNLGFEIPYDHEQTLAVNNIGKSYQYLSSLNSKNTALDRFKIFGLCILSKISSLSKIKASNTSYKVVTNKKLTEGIEKLIQSNVEHLKDGFAIHQTSEFQEWRIYQNPNYFKTHTYSFYEGEKLVALVLFNSHPNGVAYVCQSVFHADLNAGEKEQILKTASSLLFEEGISLIRNWVFNTNSVNSLEISTYQNTGHTHLNRGIGLVWKDIGNTNLKPDQFLLSRIATQGAI